MIQRTVQIPLRQYVILFHLQGIYTLSVYVITLPFLITEIEYFIFLNLKPPCNMLILPIIAALDLTNANFPRGDGFQP